MMRHDLLHVLVLATLVFSSAVANAGPAPFRIRAPLEDAGPHVQVPVFGSVAGQERTDETLWVMEWVAKRTWHVLGLPYERKDFTGPPTLKVTRRNGWVEVEGTVSDGGVPLRNQIITCQIEPLGEPLLIVLRSTDAFGEILMELDLPGGQVRARSVTVSRSMIGGQSHSSPMPEQSSNRIIDSAAFPPLAGGPVKLRIQALGKDVTLWINDEKVFAFVDPDPAGGKFGFGSTGRMRVRNIEQWELISPAEKERRQECHREMYLFSKKVDLYYDEDVRKRNGVEPSEDGVLWTWRATGARARLRVAGPRCVATVRSGLYGDHLLFDGVFPEVRAFGRDGEAYTPDDQRSASVERIGSTLQIRLPLRSRGTTATAVVEAQMTVQTVWFWTVVVEGANTRAIQALLGLAPEFALDESGANHAASPAFGLVPLPGKTLLRHQARAGLFLKAIEPENTALGVIQGDRQKIGISTTDPRLRFATVILPAQPLNLTGFKHRMVHFIRYPEGPVQLWRREPSPQTYPTQVDLARYAGHGADAMVWHHTWISSDFRDREGFLVNPLEMKRAMEETHQLGLKTIGYLGIVPGRSSLLGFEDTCPINAAAAYGRYPKNWDLQDQTFYHVAGRYPEFIAWMADYWCKEYGLDGFYLDGGAFGQLSRGPLKKPLHPEDANLSLDELQHRAYYRVKKVLELNGAAYGLEPWSGLNWMLNGFYDCMMIGESFQEASPEYYRNGHNALLTGCMVKMYGMRESSQNPYNIAMAAVNLGDIQVCSGNGAWGDDPDTTDTWNRVRPLWDLLDSIDWDHLVEARPWYAQELVGGDGFYAGHYTEPKRALVFLANRSETPGTFKVRMDPARLPPHAGEWHLRYCLGRKGDIGPLGDGTLDVDLPALHDVPIGIELRAIGQGVDEDRPRASLGRSDDFTPSVEGKKLLHFRGPVEGVDEVAFDGVITGGDMVFYRQIDAEKLGRWAKETGAKDFGRHTDNFYLCYSYPGKTAGDFDWFDETPWMVENWRLMAAAAKQAGFKGICFDTEYYEGLPLFGYYRMRHRDSQSFAAYQAQVRKRAAEMMRAVNESFPDITILVLFGFSGSFHGVPQHPVSRRQNYTLVSAFVDGLLSECGPEARIFDMHEQSFSFRVPGSYARARAMVTERLAEMSFDPERYRRNHRVGFSFWADCWGDDSKGRPFAVEDPKVNYYTPQEMAYSLHHALAYSDGYVWMWPGALNWWGKKVKTRDAAGHSVERSLPSEYLEALRKAHERNVAEPPRNRKSNTWRVLSAQTQEGWSDEETFADLWATHKLIDEIPNEWRFRMDPEEAGVTKGWHRRDFDDQDWPKIKIREFWEPQGYSPYDGAAWYRLNYSAPDLPRDRKTYLAFGGVADEASIYVNGKLCFASRYGENIRHQRFLADVTIHLQPRCENRIAVRVCNTGWCGGIWKSVKLVAPK